MSTPWPIPSLFTASPSAADLLPVGDDVQLPSPPWTISALNVPPGFTAAGRLSVWNRQRPELDDSCSQRGLPGDHGSTETAWPGQHTVLGTTAAGGIGAGATQPEPSLALEATVKANTLPGTASWCPAASRASSIISSVGNAGAEIVPPAYFHKVDASDPTSNKGLNQLRMNVDFVLSAIRKARPLRHGRKLRPRRRSSISVRRRSVSVSPFAP